MMMLLFSLNYPLTIKVTMLSLTISLPRKIWILQIKNLKYRPSKTSVYLFCSKSWSRISGQVERLFTVFHKFMLLLQFSHSVVFDSLRPHESQHARPPSPGLHHQLLEFTQTHIHWVGDAIQPSHPLSSSSPSAPNPSQHQSLFQWVNSSWLPTFAFQSPIMKRTSFLGISSKRSCRSS